ncbi:hypothetical protein L3i22_068780 [Actinoplanes sp. L3-i22]|nr:hypothetical protein L3i22_068780 [Actinoplanes sp. L3-i22]
MFNAGIAYRKRPCKHVRFKINSLLPYGVKNVPAVPRRRCRSGGARRPAGSGALEDPA